jgi:pimeloyl-ACP methyl ester carboxylesterase
MEISAASLITLKTGATLALQSFGRANNKPTVLFTHGFGQNRLAWRSSCSALAERGWHSVCFDARGHGDSQWLSDSNYELDDFSADLVAVRERIAGDVILVGASMGGLLGLIAQSQHDLFAAMVLVDVTPTWEKAGVERIFAFMRAFPDGFDSLEAAADAVNAYLPHREDKDPQRLRGHLRTNAAGRLIWHWDPRLLDHIPNASERYQPRLIDAARKVRCPVHLLAGTRSDVISASTIAAFQAMVPHATTVNITDATHMVVGDQNDRFLTELLNYLNTFLITSKTTELV